MFKYTPLKFYLNTSTKRVVDANNNTSYIEGDSNPFNVYFGDTVQLEVRPLDADGTAQTFNTGVSFVFVAGTGTTPLVQETFAKGASLHNPTGGVLSTYAAFTGSSISGALGANDELAMDGAIWQYPSGDSVPSLLGVFELSLNKVILPA